MLQGQKKIQKVVGQFGKMIVELENAIDSLKQSKDSNNDQITVLNSSIDALNTENQIIDNDIAKAEKVASNIGAIVN